MLLLFSPLIGSVLETSLNHVIFRDRSMKPAYQRLKSKTLKFVVKELPAPLMLVFSEQKIDVLNDDETAADCTITTNVASLLKLRDRQQLAALINQHDIHVDGDIQVLQHVVTLLDKVEWDLSEYLAPYIGDIAAESLHIAGNKMLAAWQKIACRSKQHLTQAVTEEWRLAPGALETAYFNDQLEDLSRELNALSQRIAKLELAS